MSYRLAKSFGADAPAGASSSQVPQVELTPDGQKDPAFQAALKTAQWTADGVKSGQFLSESRSGSALKYVPILISETLTNAWKLTPVPGTKLPRGASSFDVKLGPDDAKTSVDVGSEIKNGFAVLMDSKPNAAGMFGLVLSKNPEEIFSLARAGGSHLVVSIPADLEKAARPGSKLNGNRIFGLPVNFKTFALIGGSFVAGALFVRAIKR